MKNCRYYLLFLFLCPLFLFGQDLYDISKIQEVKIYLDDPYWQNKLNAYKKQGGEKRLIGKVEVNGVMYDSVGVRYKGNSSYFNTKKSGSTKLPFNIKINHIDKKQKLTGGFTTLKLSNVFRDPSFLREVMSYEIASNYFPAPRANFAKVYINDEYLGLYNSSESVDKKFLKAHFGDKNGVFFKCDPIWKATQISDCPINEKATLKYLGDDPNCYKNSYEIKSDTGWATLMNFTRELAQNPDQIEKWLDVDQALWMLAFNAVLVNLDSYTGRLAHNYYIYQDTNGRFHPIIWDMNMSFGGFRFDGSGRALNNEQLQTISPFIHYKTRNPDRPLIVQLLRNNLYRKIYIAHIRTILNDHFNNGKYKERALAIQAIIEKAVEEDNNKLYDFEGFKKNLSETTLAKTSKIIGITELMEKRTEYLSNHPTMQGEIALISEVNHSSTEDKISITAKVEKAQNLFLAYKNSQTPYFQHIKMLDDGNQNDGASEDGVFGIYIDNIPNTKFYLIAEGERSATLMPEGGAFESYEAVP